MNTNALIESKSFESFGVMEEVKRMNRLENFLLLLLLLSLLATSLLQFVNQVQQNSEISRLKKLNQDFSKMNEVREKLIEQQKIELQEFSSLRELYRVALSKLKKIEEQQSQ